MTRGPRTVRAAIVHRKVPRCGALEEPMSLSARSIAVLTALTALSGLFFALMLGTGQRAGAQGGTPVVASPNVELIKSNPGTAAISGVFSRSAPYFYVSGLDSVTVFDVSDPRNPVQTGKLVNAIFENEAMTLGERLEGDKVRRFVLLGNDLVQASPGPGGIQRGRLGGGELIIVDVSDPANPNIVGRTPSTGTGAATTSTHTVACMNASCSIAYSAGDGGKFSVFDLSDLSKPKQIREVASPAAAPNPIFTTGAGHHWSVDGAAVAWHTGSGGTAAFDVSDPLSPQALNATDANGTKSPYNDFIHHNSQRPNALAFAPGKGTSVTNGNVALVTEEDYANEGDEVVCDRAGTFQTWEVPSLDGGAYRAANPKSEPNKGSIRVLDTINPPAESGGGLSAPAGGFCSAHWFDYHQSGVIAQGYYQQGLRLVNVRDPRNLKQEGFFTGGGTEVWDAYWAPQREPSGRVRPGYKTNIIYTVDAVRGVDVFEVKNLPPDLPVTGDDGGRGAFPADPVAVGAANQTRTTGCGAPESAVTRTSSRLSRSGLRLRGTARGRGCSVRQVRVAIGRKVGKQCRFLKANGRFGAKRSCLRTQYLRAKGTTRWTLNKRVRLPRGSYLVWSRAIDSAGQIERKAKARNLLARRIRR
jgi:hypothetical protein